MLAIAIFSIPICLADWRYRRIPNIYIIFLAYSIALERVFFGLHSISIVAWACLFAVMAWVFLRVGMGDVKLFLLAVLALNLHGISSLFVFLICIYCSALAQIALMSGINFRIPRSVPLAFAIFIGTGLYLGAKNSTNLQEYADALVNSW